MPLPMRPRPKNPILKKRENGKLWVEWIGQGKKVSRRLQSLLPQKPGVNLRPPQAPLSTVLTPREQSQMGRMQIVPFLISPLFKSVPKFKWAFLNPWLPQKEVRHIWFDRGSDLTIPWQESRYLFSALQEFQVLGLQMPLKKVYRDPWLSNWSDLSEPATFLNGRRQGPQSSPTSPDSKPTLPLHSSS